MAAKQANRQRVLDAMPGTQAQIIERTGLGLATVSRWVADLREHRQARIIRWVPTPNGGPLAAVHAPGRGRDAPKPSAPPPAQRVRRYRARLRATGEWADRQARERARYWASKPPRRDPLVAAFFGAAA